MTELKPCPFCGGEAWLRSPRYPLAADCDDAVVSCYDCSAIGPSILCDMDDIDAENHWPAAQIAATTAWNTRAAEEGKAELVEAAEAVLAEFRGKPSCDGWWCVSVHESDISALRAALARVRGEG